MATTTTLITLAESELGWLLLGTLLLGILLLAYARKPPVSFPGNARAQQTTRQPHWPETPAHHEQQKTSHWHFRSGQNSSTFGGRVIGSAVGRQVWQHSPEQPVAVQTHFNPSENPNTTDQLYRGGSCKTSTTSSSSKTTTNTTSSSTSKSQVLAATREAVAFYQQLQSEDGHWPGDYGGPMFLLPGLVISSYITGVELGSATKRGMTSYLSRHQQSDGGWGTHIEGASTLFGTVLSYVSLRLLQGESVTISTSTILRRAQAFILDNGGALRTPSWGKFWLTVAGLHDWAGCNSIPPELWLLPRWFPFHPGRLWCHCRMVYLPMSYLYGMRFTPTLTPLLTQIRAEIYTQPYDSIDWTAARTTRVSPLDVYSPPTLLMRLLNRLLSIYEQRPLQALRTAALKFAIEYIYAEDAQTHYICIGPVNKTLNLLSVFCHAGAASHELQLHKERLVDYLWVAEDGVKMQGYNGSQMWDTSFAAQAILETGLAAEFGPCLRKAHSFMDQTQIRENEKDHVKWFRHESKGGWPFSTNAHGWPISDCTAEGLKAMIRLQAAEKEGVGIVPQHQHLSPERFQDAVNVILTLQNVDGGWATYENNRGFGWFEYLNPSEVFGDIMIDYSYVECSSACMSALKTFAHAFPTHRASEISHAIRSGATFIKSIQRPDGSWYGSWGVCFTYGTWFGIEGLLAAGESSDCAEIVKACAFLLSKQRADGGWSESILSCVDKQYTEHADGSQVIATSWALLGLMKGSSSDRRAVQRGIQFLMQQQCPTGDWPQQAISGVFNRNCGITYTAYRNIFPIWALGVFASQEN